MTDVSRRSGLVLLFAFLFAALGGYQWAQARLAQPEVRRSVEAWARRVLQADVSVGQLRYVLPASVAVQDVQVSPEGGTSAVPGIAVKELVFGYGLVNLIRGDFRAPGTIKLVSPQIYFPLDSGLRLPFLDLGADSSKVTPLAVAVERGEFHYPWKEGEELLFSQVHFEARPRATGQIRVELRASLGGVASGDIELQGVTDAEFHRYELEVRLEDVGFGAAPRIPLQSLSGRFKVSDQTIEVLGASMLFHGWQLKYKGKVEDWQAKPRISLDVVHEEGKPPFGLSFEMDLVSERLAGTWKGANRSYPFQGVVQLEGKRVLFSALELPHDYRGRGEVDFSSGDYEFWFERERRRFRVQSNLGKTEILTEFELNHTSVNRLDWVVLGTARGQLLPKRRGEAGPRFKVDLQTQYLIVEYQPLEDFHGSFEIGPEGVEAVDLEWGGVFHLEGRILFRGGEPRQDLTLRVEGYPLEQIREFSGRPLPENLKGLLEGKLKVRGAVSGPEIEGYFTVKDGMIEKLDFDRALISFRGFPPQLRLYDSKVFRGRNVLKMTGVIDLRLENLFHGIQIQGTDHLVLWKGMDVFWKEGKSGVVAEKPLGKKVTTGIEVGIGGSGTGGEDREEGHALMGSRLKF